MEIKNLIYLAGIPIMALGLVILLIGYFKSRPPKFRCNGCGMELRVDEVAYMAGPPSGPDTIYCVVCAKNYKKDVRSLFATEEAYQAFLKGRRHA